MFFYLPEFHDNFVCCVQYEQFIDRKLQEKFSSSNSIKDISSGSNRIIKSVCQSVNA